MAPVSGPQHLFIESFLLFRSGRFDPAPIPPHHELFSCPLCSLMNCTFPLLTPAAQKGGSLHRLHRSGTRVLSQYFQSFRWRLDLQLSKSDKFLLNAAKTRANEIDNAHRILGGVLSPKSYTENLPRKVSVSLLFQRLRLWGSERPFHESETCSLCELNWSFVCDSASQQFRPEMKR
jgi:hypothetical protein